MSPLTAHSAERLPEIRAVIFDLDGTLIDSMPLVMRAFAHALAPFRPDLDMAGIFRSLGGPPLRTFQDLIGDAAKADEAMRRLESFGFENGSLVQPFEGMRSMLEMLHAAGLQLAIWTGRDRQTTEALLTAHNLVTFFTVVVCGDDLPTHKPHPAGLLKILAHLDVKAHEALYSGDADADVLGGAEAGVRTVLIHHGREVETPILTRAWHVVETPPQAYALIAAVLKTDAATPRSDTR